MPVLIGLQACALEQAGYRIVITRLELFQPFAYVLGATMTLDVREKTRQCFIRKRPIDDVIDEIGDEAVGR